MRALPAALLALALAAPPPAAAQNRAAFEAQLEALRTALGIPSMSAAVVEGGTIVWVRHFGVEAGPGESVRYPIASLTKPLAATLALRLVERGRLSLDEPVPGAGPGVRVRDLLSQTAAGTPGARFVYSSALFAKLQAPIERAARASFASALEANVLTPAGMRHTVAGARATPSTGVESTVEDLARFTMALGDGRLLKGASLATMFRPPRDEGGHPFPYALGWFVQPVGGEQVRWCYGQQAGGSALMLTLPRRRLSFVLLARSDRLSAPFWLQFGDLRWSPAAVAFFDRWARVRVDLASARRTMLDALVAFGAGKRADGVALAKQAAVLAPPLVNAADPVLLAVFARSGDASLRDTGRRIARRLLAADPGQPRVLLDLAVLELQDGHADAAADLLKQVLDGGQATPEIAATARELVKDVRSAGLQPCAGPA